MSKVYVPREIEPLLKKYLSTPEILIILGPRQSGKSTLLRHIAADLQDSSFISFEDVDILALFEADIKGFYKLHVKPFRYVVIDEIQYAANFGRNMPAVGFALGVERSMLVARPEVDIAPDLVIASSKHRACHALAAQARRQGLRVEMDVLGRREEDLVAYARNRGAVHIIYPRDATTYVLTEGETSRELGLRALEEEIASWNR